MQKWWKLKEKVTVMVAQVTRIICAHEETEIIRFHDEMASK